jgi:hypothetical protein
MDFTSCKGARPAVSFKSAFNVLQKRLGKNDLNTGSPQLDELLGGLEPGLFYLFYASRGDRFPDTLLHRIIVEAMKSDDARVIWLICGNYRRSRTTIDPELILSFIEELGLDVTETLSRIHVVCSFSERHLIKTPDLVKGILENHHGFTLVVVQQIAKIFYGKKALRFQSLTEFTGTVSRLKTMCSERDIVLVATTRNNEHGSPIPEPEGGSYIRHTANVILYFKSAGKQKTSAHLVKHPDRSRVGMTITFNEVNYHWEE